MKKQPRETFEKASHFPTFTFQACGLRPVNTRRIRQQPSRQPQCADAAEIMNVGGNMPGWSITPADIQSADWSLMLDRSSVSQAAAAGLGSVVQGVADVNQCIAIILGTPKGADPLRPTFGADIWQYIDYPIQAAIPAIAREITEAITLWEPRN